MDHGLDARLDATGHFAEHAVIDFTKHDRKLQEAKSKLLAAHAETRGCLFMQNLVRCDCGSVFDHTGYGQSGSRLSRFDLT